MKYRLIAFDLDYTLLNSQQSVTDEARAADHADAAVAILDHIAAGLSDSHRAAFWHDPRRRRWRSALRPRYRGAVDGLLLESRIGFQDLP